MPGAMEADRWARLRLVQGSSRTPTWELVGSKSETRLTVGRDRTCQWIVDDPSIAPVHFTLRWDGSALEVADTHAAGLSLDGRPVPSRWTPVAGRARLEFGRCAIVAETSAGRASASAAPLQIGSVPPPASTATPLPPRGGASPVKPPQRTMLGVAPIVAGPAAVKTTPSVRVAGAIHAGSSKPPAPRPEPARPASSRPPGSFRPSRPVEAGRKDKSTVMGMSPVQLPRSPAAASPQPSATPAARRASSKPPLGGGELSGSTLYGVGDSERPASTTDVVKGVGRTQTPAPMPAIEDTGGRETSPGFMGEAPGRPTSPGHMGDPASARRAADATPGSTRLVDDTAQLRRISGAPTAIVVSSPGSAAPQDAEEHRTQILPGGEGVPQAVLIGAEPLPSPGAPASDEVPGGEPGASQPAAGSEPPADGAGASHESTVSTEPPGPVPDPGRPLDRPSWGPGGAGPSIPWRYLFIGVGVVVAYIAWIKVLEHF